MVFQALQKPPIDWILRKMSVLNITWQMCFPGLLLGQTSLSPSDNVLCGVVAPWRHLPANYFQQNNLHFPQDLTNKDWILQLSHCFPFATVRLGQDLFGYSHWSCWLRPRHLGSTMTLFFSSIVISLLTITWSAGRCVYYKEEEKLNPSVLFSSYSYHLDRCAINTGRKMHWLTGGEYGSNSYSNHQTAKN